MPQHSCRNTYAATLVPQHCYLNTGASALLAGTASETELMRRDQGQHETSCLPLQQVLRTPSAHKLLRLGAEDARVPCIQCVAAYCSVFKCVAAYCSVFKCVAAYCSVFKCVAVYCSVFKCVAVC